MVDESELPIPATMVKTDQRRGGEGSTQERRASKEILEAEPTEPGDPSPGDGGTFRGVPHLRRGRAGLGNRAPRLPGGQSAQFHCPRLLRAWSQALGPALRGRGGRRQTEGLHLPAATSRRRPS